MRQSKNTDKLDEMMVEFSKFFAYNCVRNTMIEDIHAGKSPYSKKGDYSDVFIIDANGEKLPYNSISRITEAEMKAFIKNVVNKTYGLMFMRKYEPEKFNKIAYFLTPPDYYDNPEPDDELANI